MTRTRNNGTGGPARPAVVAIAAAVALGLAPAALPAQAAEAIALRVTAPAANRAEVAHAPLGASGMTEASVDRIQQARITSGLATAVITGGTQGAAGVATLANLDLLNGLITARNVIAVAARDARGLDASGSGFEALVVNGVPIATDGTVAPNTRITLPGVGYVVLNEQVVSGGALQVTMIRVVQESAGKRSGEIAVASVNTGR